MYLYNYIHFFTIVSPYPVHTDFIVPPHKPEHTQTMPLKIFLDFLAWLIPVCDMLIPNTHYPSSWPRPSQIALPLCVSWSLLASPWDVFHTLSEAYKDHPALCSTSISLLTLSFRFLYAWGNVQALGHSFRPQYTECLNTALWGYDCWSDDLRWCWMVGQVTLQWHAT